LSGEKVFFSRSALKKCTKGRESFAKCMQRSFRRLWRRKGKLVGSVQFSLDFGEEKFANFNMAGENCQQALDLVRILGDFHRMIHHFKGIFQERLETGHWPNDQKEINDACFQYLDGLAGLAASHEADTRRESFHHICSPTSLSQNECWIFEAIRKMTVATNIVRNALLHVETNPREFRALLILLSGAMTSSQDALGYIGYKL
jgi:hypothetical protein